MILAFALYKYFPFGGLQRDFLRIALECQKQGHTVRVYTTSWQGDKPEGFDIKVLPPQGSSNHKRMASFQKQIGEALKEKPADQLIGFNKMPGLDIYYAADTCYRDKAYSSRSWWYRLTPRYRHYSVFEESVFSKDSDTLVLAISRLQKPVFQKYYGTPDNRILLLPPGISRDRQRPDDAAVIRQAFRKEFNLDDDDRLLLMIGSGFKTKGLDRTVQALASLPESLKKKTRLFVIGQDKQKPFEELARQLGVADKLTFLSGRDDVPRFLLGADLLIHPAYNENTGTVLLEAMVAGLPVLTTDVCGYAHYITDADAGKVARSPFSQEQLNQLTSEMLQSDQKQQWQTNAIQFCRREDIYSMPECAANIIIDAARRKERVSGGSSR
ncbi:MAG: glycosyltransferase family 4 protein [Endozoicomonas sp.]